MIDNSTHILIAGAGLVGSTLALALAKQHPSLNIALIDTKPLGAFLKIVAAAYDPRVVALNQQSIQLLNQLDVWQRVVAARACAYCKMNVWDGEGTARIEFDAAEVHQSTLGYIVENNILLGALHEALMSCANVTAVAAEITSWRNTDAGATVNLNTGEVLTAPLLVGADGANSAVRSFGTYKTREWSYQQSAIVTTVKTERPHQATAWQRFTDDGPLAFLPLAAANADEQGLYCSIVWSMNQDVVQATAALTDEQFCAKLTRQFEATLGEVTWADTRHTIPLKQMHVLNYFDQHSVLVGDAAHTIHPLAGQGVNVGLRDVSVLLDELKRAQDRKIPLNEVATLKRYQRRVQTHNLATMAVMEGFKRVYAERNPWLRVVRNLGVKMANKTPPLKREFIELAMGRTG